MHIVVFTDNDDNWKRWGTLVDYWIDQPINKRPHDIAGLGAQMEGAGITGVLLAGHPVLNHPDPTRPVNVNTYDHSVRRPIVIPVPTAAMRDADRSTLTGNTTYPLPLFYTTIFGSAPTKIFSKAELDDMAKRRLGEYVINECM
jgi:hypothetical protein